MGEGLSIGYDELANEKEADDSLLDLASLMAKGRFEGSEKSLSSIPDLMTYVDGTLRITHRNFTMVYVCKQHYQTKESLKILKEDPNISVRFLNVIGRTNITYDGMDVITLSHIVPENTSVIQGHPKKHLMEIIISALESMGYPVSRIELPNTIYPNTYDHFLSINGKKFASTSIIKSNVDATHRYYFETVLMTYDYDDDLYRKCLPDKSYYKQIQGECAISDPDEIAVDTKFKRFTGLIQEFPDFNIDVFRKQMFIEAGKKLNLDLIMKDRIKESFFDKETISFVTPIPSHKIFKYKIGNKNVVKK